VRKDEPYGLKRVIHKPSFCKEVCSKSILQPGTVCVIEKMAQKIYRRHWLSKVQKHIEDKTTFQSPGLAITFIETNLAMHILDIFILEIICKPIQVFINGAVPGFSLLRFFPFPLGN